MSAMPQEASSVGGARQDQASASPASPAENDSEEGITALVLTGSVLRVSQTFPWSNAGVLRSAVQSRALRPSVRRAWLGSPRAEGTLSPWQSPSYLAALLALSCHLLQGFFLKDKEV